MVVIQSAVLLKSNTWWWLSSPFAPIFFIDDDPDHFLEVRRSFSQRLLHIHVDGIGC
jgi:hypothetical protein